MEIRIITYCDATHYETAPIDIEEDDIDELTKIYCKSYFEFDWDYYYIETVDLSKFKDYLFYAPYFGGYALKSGLTANELYKYINCYGQGNYPYTIKREYEAENNLKRFGNTAHPENNIEYDFSKYLYYTFGLEFETSCGYVAEDKCFSKGLIPLRDGSIGGVEYSTVVLEGNKGINLLREEMEELRNTTFFDKECSLHIHFGGFPVKPEYVFNFYKFWTFFQNTIKRYIPCYSYKTARYKDNAKDYCKIIPWFDTFEEMFSYYTKDKYMGSLYQPHRDDIEKQAKWHISGRYYNCNFINMLCYNKAKTLEFRFLRPTYNFRKVITWILVLNAALRYVEQITKNNKKEEINNILNMLFSRSDAESMKLVLTSVYPMDLVNKLMHNLFILENVVMTQTMNRDYCGMRVDIEDKMFEDGE